MDRTHFERIAIPKWSRMLIVTGYPGNRSDFVVGWLAKNHPSQFVLPGPWSIDPVVGTSLVLSVWNWNSWNWQDDATVLGVRELIRGLVLEQHDPHALWAISKSHTTSDRLLEILPEQMLDHFVILDILAHDARSVRQILWENFVKNFLAHLIHNNQQTIDLTWGAHARRLGMCEHQLDTLSLLQAEYRTLVQQSNDSRFTLNPRMNTTAVGKHPCVRAVNYCDLMTARGPEILAQQLGLPLSCEGWDLPLELARSRDSYHVLGQWWHRPNS